MWEECGRCVHCKGVIDNIKFCDPFFKPVCPYCGEKNEIETVIARLKKVTKWYKPSTWFKYEWEIKSNEV